MEPIEQTKSIRTHTDHTARFRIVFDSESTAPVGRYTICFEGRCTVVVAQPFESPAAVWQRVIELIDDIRAVIRRGAWRGREYYFATVYAGIQPTEQQQKEHMKDWISACLYQLADPAHNKDEGARVDALIALAELHGLNAPRRYAVNLPVSAGELRAIAAKGACSHVALEHGPHPTETTRPLQRVLN